MRPPPAPNRFRHFSRDVRAVLKSRQCRIQHRESFLHASQASPLPTFGKSAGAVPGTTNAFLRRETSSRIPLGALAFENIAKDASRSSRAALYSARRTAVFRFDQDT